MGAQISTTNKMHRQVPNDRMMKATTMANKLAKIGLTREAKKKTLLTKITPTAMYGIENADPEEAGPLLKVISQTRAKEFTDKIVKRFADVAKRSTDAALRIGSKFTAGITDPKLRDRISISEALTKRLVESYECTYLN